jgi:hypothetical protein
MAAKKKRTGVEWVGGLVSMPAYVTGEGDPYRPETLFWMGAQGAVLGHTVGKPGELVGLLCEIGSAAIAAFFRAAAELYRAKPWKTVPSDRSLVSVTIEKLGVKFVGASRLLP